MRDPSVSDEERQREFLMKKKKIREEREMTANMQTFSAVVGAQASR